jgi:hypothetical protein
MSIRAIRATHNSLGRLLRLAAILFAVATCLPAQQKVDTRQLYERLYCVLPMNAGKGTWADPKRPMYAPAQLNPSSRTGIIGYTYVLSDDGQFALVEFVARDAAAFAPILADATVKSFRKGKDKREDIEAEFRKHKKDFSFENFGGVMVP